MLGLTAATKAAETLKIEKGRKIALQGGGFVAGGAAGACIYVTLNENTLFFKTWKFLKITSITNEHISNEYENDGFLNQFIDCISYQPLMVPVRLSTGHLIDLDTLKRIKPDNNGDILCPHTREKLDFNMPNIDLELYTLIMKRYQYLLKETLSKVQPNSEEHNAASLQLEIVEKQLCFSHERHLKGLDQLYADGKLTNIELNHLRVQFYTHFGIDPVGRADQQNGIEAHVMYFEEDWKKIISYHSTLIFKGTPQTEFIEM